MSLVCCTLGAFDHGSNKILDLVDGGEEEEALQLHHTPKLTEMKQSFSFSIGSNDAGFVLRTCVFECVGLELCECY